MHEIIQKFLRYCSLEENLALSYVKSMESSFKTFLRRTGIKELNEVNVEVLRNFFYDGKEKYQWSASTSINHWKYLKKFFDWCISQGLLKENPIVGIKKPKLPKHLPRGLAREEASKILYASFNYPWRYSFEAWRNHAIIATLLFTGIRARELRMLRITDVNLNSARLFINSGKGRKDRYIPIHPTLKRILQSYIDEVKRLRKDGEFFFTGIRSNLPLSPKDIAAICKKLSNHLCIKFTCHTLRHTCATELLNQNINLYKVSQILGHSDVRTTTIYLNVATRDLQKDIDAIEMYRNGS